VRDPAVEIWRPDDTVRWDEPDTAVRQLEAAAARFLGRARRNGRPWSLWWCAGAGVVSTAPELVARETLLLERFLAVIGSELSADAPLAAAGGLFFASSAGGVYAGCRATPPFDELSPVQPLAPYGSEKLLQEEMVRQLADTTGVDVLIGRLSNLYGPGQNLSKPQGLISHVGRAALRREPVSIYVPLDTIRDYLYVGDARRMVVEAMEMRAATRRRGEDSGPNTKIFASEVESTVASVLGAWRQSLRRPLRVALASSPAGQLQPRVLSFRSRVWPDVRGQPTLLPQGIEAVRRDQLARLLAAGFPLP
jgi:UDP-glucose 4-epimerase